MSIAGNIDHLRKEIPQRIKIVAVSKTISPEQMKEAYNAGQRIFGENKVQELRDKHQVMPKDMEWHLIGHLQTNKVKYIVPLVHLIHSVDSLRLLSEINREAGIINRTIDCLLQMRIAREETKYGMSYSDTEQLLSSDEYNHFNNVRITGLMGIATYTNDSQQIKDEFLQLAGYFSAIKSKWFPDRVSFRELSMGMSGDYRLAIETGSTMVRIGSLIFGDRNYKK